VGAELHDGRPHARVDLGAGHQGQCRQFRGYSLSLGGSISANGSKVAFESRATNLDPADTDSILDIYVKTIA